MVFDMYTLIIFYVVNYNISWLYYCICLNIFRLNFPPLGTVWKYEGVLDGAGKAICRLEEHGKQIIYVTNNSLRTDDEYLAKFKESGIVPNIVGNSEISNRVIFEFDKLTE